MSSSRYGKTYYLRSENDPEPIPLTRRWMQGRHDGKGFDEDWLQHRLITAPDLLPIGELDPAFAPLIPLCRELPTASGYVDLAYINPQGRLTLVECKLWKNPEARRKVVAQILEYAKELSQWSYESLDESVRRAAPDSDSSQSLYERVRIKDEGVDQATFVDDVTRCLRSGRFLLIIVGDGIREEVQQIADYLKQFAGIQFVFGLVELVIFDMPGGGFIVEPRVMARTETITRSVVELASPALTVKDPVPAEDAGSETTSRLTRTEFYRQIELQDPGLSPRIK